jgi:multidrug efflux pump subunit AcrA (membrane-fusion protein)
VQQKLPVAAAGEGYELRDKFDTAGEYKLIFDVRTSDGRNFAVDFPVSVVAAPVNWTFWLAAAVLTLLALAVAGGYLYAWTGEGVSVGRAVWKSLPVAAGALVAWGAGVGALWYFVGPRVPRAVATTTAAPAAATGATGGGHLTIPKESQLLFNIRTQVVEKREVTGGLKVTGVVQARPDARAVVVPPVAGRVTLRAGLTIGSAVGRGETIGTVEQVLDVNAQAGLESQRLDVEARRLEVEAQRLNLNSLVLEQKARLAEQRSLAQQARTRLAQAQREQKRAEALVEVGAAPQRRVEEARTAVKLAEQEITVAEQQTVYLQEQIKTVQTAQPRFQAPQVRPPNRTFPLVAPVTGLIADIKAANGQQVETGTEILSLANLTTVFLAANVFEKDLPAVREATQGTWTAAGIPNEVYRLGVGGDGRLVTVGQTVDPNTRTVPVIYEVKNPLNRLREGMFVEIALDSEKRETLAAPKAAVVNEQGQTFVFVFNGGESFERRAVVLGLEGQDFYEIKTGLKEDERIVTEGIYQLRAALGQ